MNKKIIAIKIPEGVEVIIGIHTIQESDALTEEQQYEEDCWEALSSIGDMDFD